MRSIRLYPLLLIVLVAPLLTAQAGPRQQIVEALALEREGHPEQAIVALQALLDSKSLSGPEAGEAENILGLSYKDQGDFALSERAFEQSIRLLERSYDRSRDYAMALDNFGGLLLAMGQPEAAGRMREKALHVYEKTNDHTGVAIACNNLAGVAFEEKSLRRGKKYLQRARREAELASGLDDDDRAAIFSMQGWLALLEGDALGAASAYQQSLDLWRQRHGEEHPSTGWGYVLVGNAKAEAGELPSALADMQKGLAVLDRTAGRQSARYLTAEMAYSRLLDQTGSRAEAVRMKADAERGLQDLHRSQCTGCTLSAAAFR
ncbi:MAG: tetratricopeptide repeat protein [Candidatus Sulfotelmatobacter sp.]